jgi:hypothetical protein
MLFFSFYQRKEIVFSHDMSLVHFRKFGDTSVKSVLLNVAYIVTYTYFCLDVE